LLLADAATPADVVAVLRALSTSRHPAVWRRIASVVGALRRLAGADGTDAIAALARKLAGPVLAESDGSPAGDGRDAEPEVHGIAWRLAGGPGSDPLVIEGSRRHVEDPDGVHPEL